ncbi:unnamed protein product [Auanema sp. JU1783]|nr:unnamed protein product [Auanema sp. JU1783]
MSGSCGIVNPYTFKNKRAAKGEAYEPTHHEHYANTLSHAIGVLPSILIFSHMITSTHNSMQFYLMLVYGIFTTLLFCSSTCYHFCELCYREKREQPTLRFYLHICDRAAIYLFIAASYTPWLFLREYDCYGLNMKYLVWVFALLGILYQYNFHERYKTLEIVIYITIAAGPSIAIFNMKDQSGLDIMLFGGIIYLAGVIFFKMDGIIPFAHAIWHVFVLAGSSCHTYAVYSTLLKPDIGTSNENNVDSSSLYSRVDL